MTDIKELIEQKRRHLEAINSDIARWRKDLPNAVGYNHILIAAIYRAKANAAKLQNEIQELEGRETGKMTERKPRTINEVKFEISSIEGALQDKLQWQAEIEHELSGMSPADIFGKTKSFKKLRKEFRSVEKEIHILQNTLSDLRDELSDLSFIAQSLIMKEDQEALGKEIVAAIQSFIKENYPNVRAVVSTNLNVSVLTLTEKPTPELFFEIGRSVNQFVRNTFSDRIETRVIVTVGQVIDGDNSVSNDNNNDKIISRLAEDRFAHLTELGQIPKEGRRILIDITSDEFNECLRHSSPANELIAVKSIAHGQVQAGDILLFRIDGKALVSSPYYVEGQSEAILQNVCLTFLKKLPVSIHF